MSRKDFYHDEVRRALEKDGWEITHDPYRVRLDRGTISIDLGAEMLLAAEKESQKVAVEVKNFIGPSNINELHRMVGQFVDYTIVLEQVDPERILYVAIPEEAWINFMQIDTIMANLQRVQIKILVVDVETETLMQWITIKPRS